MTKLSFHSCTFLVTCLTLKVNCVIIRPMSLAVFLLIQFLIQSVSLSRNQEYWSHVRGFDIPVDYYFNISFCFRKILLKVTAACSSLIQICSDIRESEIVVVGEHFTNLQTAMHEMWEYFRRLWFICHLFILLIFYFMFIAEIGNDDQSLDSLIATLPSADLPSES